MEQFDKKAHWDKIYQTKSLNEVSWFQPKPETSLNFFKEFNIPKEAKIIDIGGGDSLLVDHLLDLGYQHITVLDISATALERAKIRLGDRASLVKWIVADASTFVSEEQYDFWHDRAAFHFLTSEQEIEHYLHTVQQSIKPSGILVMGTFSEQGPTKCSGIEIKQYSEKSMSVLLTQFFEKIKCITVDHRTPFETIQQFIFCSFKKPQTII
jgi:2-polyprenyl-3-methyl-5-hydroxy-6-metoxy-1,4-benzoquinol methylase